MLLKTSWSERTLLSNIVYHHNEDNGNISKIFEESLILDNWISLSDICCLLTFPPIHSSNLCQVFSVQKKGKPFSSIFYQFCWCFFLKEQNSFFFLKVNEDIRMACINGIYQRMVLIVKSFLLTCYSTHKWNITRYWNSKKCFF